MGLGYSIHVNGAKGMICAQQPCQMLWQLSEHVMICRGFEGWRSKKRSICMSALDKIGQCIYITWLSFDAAPAQVCPLLRDGLCVQPVQEAVPHLSRAQVAQARP